MAYFVALGRQYVNMENVTYFVDNSTSPDHANAIRIHFVGGSEVAVADDDAHKFITLFNMYVKGVQARSR
jgi:hypothetical protein